MFPCTVSKTKNVRYLVYKIYAHIHSNTNSIIGKLNNILNNPSNSIQYISL